VNQIDDVSSASLSCHSCLTSTRVDIDSYAQAGTSLHWLSERLAIVRPAAVCHCHPTGNDVIGDSHSAGLLKIVNTSYTHWSHDSIFNTHYCNTVTLPGGWLGDHRKKCCITLVLAVQTVCYDICQIQEALRHFNWKTNCGLFNVRRLDGGRKGLAIDYHITQVQRSFTIEYGTWMILFEKHTHGDVVSKISDRFAHPLEACCEVRLMAG